MTTDEILIQIQEIGKKISQMAQNPTTTCADFHDAIGECVDLVTDLREIRTGSRMSPKDLAEYVASMKE